MLRAVSTMWARVDSLTPGRSLSAYDTSALLTPAAAATSLIRTVRRRPDASLIDLRFLGWSTECYGLAGHHSAKPPSG